MVLNGTPAPFIEPRSALIGRRTATRYSNTHCLFSILLRCPPRCIMLGFRWLLFVAFAIAVTVASAEQQPPKYRVLGSDNGRVAIIAPDGKVEWEVPTKAQVHDLT